MKSWTRTANSLLHPITSFISKVHAFPSPYTCGECAPLDYNAARLAGIARVAHELAMDTNYLYCPICHSHITPNWICACILAMLRQIQTVDLSFQRAAPATHYFQMEPSPIFSYVTLHYIVSNLTLFEGPTHNFSPLSRPQYRVIVIRPSPLNNNKSHLRHPIHLAYREKSVNK